MFVNFDGKTQLCNVIKETYPVIGFDLMEGKAWLLSLSLKDEFPIEPKKDSFFLHRSNFFSGQRTF